MSDLMNRKMEIAKKAGELIGVIDRLSQIARDVRRRRENEKVIAIKVHASDVYEINADTFGDFDLHDYLIEFLDKQTEKFKTQLDELIKIPQ